MLFKPFGNLIDGKVLVLEILFTVVDNLSRPTWLCSGFPKDFNGD
jgi:hypothetical protein